MNFAISFIFCDEFWSLRRTNEKEANISEKQFIRTIQSFIISTTNLPYKETFQKDRISSNGNNTPAVIRKTILEMVNLIIDCSKVTKNAIRI